MHTCNCCESQGLRSTCNTAKVTGIFLFAGSMDEEHHGKQRKRFTSNASTSCWQVLVRISNFWTQDHHSRPSSRSKVIKKEPRVFNRLLSNANLVTMELDSPQRKKPRVEQIPIKQEQVSASASPSCASGFRRDLVCDGGALETTNPRFTWSRPFHGQAPSAAKARVFKKPSAIKTLGMKKSSHKKVPCVRHGKKQSTASIGSQCSQDALLQWP